MSEEQVYIESPIHQLKMIEEAVKETGSAVMIVFGVDEFAKEFAGLDQAQIVEKVTALRLLPEMMMGGQRVPNSPQPIPVFVFVDQPVADVLDSIVPDEIETLPEE